MNNILGIIVSFFYFFGLLIVSQHIPLKTLEGKRKFVHIMLGNWWIIVIYLFTNVFAALVVPVCFIFINYVSLKRNKENGLLSSLERKNQKSYGIVLYPVAMSLMVLFSFSIFHDIRIGGIGLLALAYGDGIAALAGKKFNYKTFKIWNNTKSFSGCLGMFVSTYIVTAIYLYATNLSPINSIFLVSLIISLVGTIFELITPWGIDDLTVPLSAIIASWLLIH